MQRIAFGLLALLLPSTAFAALPYDLHDILANLSKVLGPAMILLIAVSYIAGIAFVLRGLMMLRAFSMPLTQATRPGEVAGPLVYMLVGTFLLYLPTTTDFITSTFFGGESPFEGSDTFKYGATGRASDKILGYAPVAIEGQWAALVDTIGYYIMFIGMIAFIRGWFIIAHAGQPGVQPGSISKGIVHIIGGILAINFIPLVEIVRNTIFVG